MSSQARGASDWSAATAGTVKAKIAHLITQDFIAGLHSAEAFWVDYSQLFKSSLHMFSPGAAGKGR